MLEQTGEDPAIFLANIHLPVELTKALHYFPLCYLVHIQKYILVYLERVLPTIWSFTLNTTSCDPL